MNKIHYNKNKDLDQLGETIIESFVIIDNHGNLKYHYETIWEILNQKSNIKEIFDSMTLSKQIFLDNIYDILNRIKQNKEFDICDDFLEELNNKLFEEYGEMNKSYINIIIYTNIPKKLETNDKFIEILKYFNLDIFKFSSYNFENEKNLDDDIKFKFKSRFLMLKYSNTARDYEFVKTEAINTIYSFFGYLTYIHRFNKDTEKWCINEITLDHKITDLNINALIGTKSNFEIFQLSRQYDILITAIEMKKSKKINLNKRMPLDYNLLEKVFELNNNRLYSQIKEYFCLYYVSSLENIIENSFLRFWSLSERIIKDIHGSSTDKKLVEYMERVLIVGHYPEGIIKRINFLRIKRNELVHENIHGKITQSDQAIIKLISEMLILFLIHNSDKVNNLEDYKKLYKLESNY